MISTINEFDFECFTIEELLEFKQIIEDRVTAVENKSEIISEKVLRYFATVDIMYGDGDIYIEYTKEITKLEYIKLELFGDVHIEFSHEHFGERSGSINAFISITESYRNLEEGRDSYELDNCFDFIDGHIIAYYGPTIDLEAIYKAVTEKDEYIKDYMIDYILQENHKLFFDYFYNKYTWLDKSVKCVNLNKDWEKEILCSILNITTNRNIRVYAYYINFSKYLTEQTVRIYKDNDSYRDNIVEKEQDKSSFICEFTIR